MPLTLSMPGGTSSTPKSENWSRWTWILLSTVVAAVLCVAFLKYEDYVAVGYSSPWDTVRVEESIVPYSCKSVPMLSASVTSPARSTSDPSVEVQSAQSVEAILMTVEDAADMYQATGSRAASDCVIQTLDKQASADAVRPLSDAPKTRELQQFSAGASAIALLKIRSSSSFRINSIATHHIVTWMKSELSPTLLYYADGGNPADSNQVWAALDLLAVSVASSDSELYETASNMLNVALWRLAPRIDTRPLNGGEQLNCSKVLPVLAPAALAFDIESAAGLSSAPSRLRLLHEVGLRCIDHQAATPKNLQMAQIEEHQPKNDRQTEQLKWLNGYLTALATTPPTVWPTSRSTLDLLLGGRLPR